MFGRIRPRTHDKPLAAAIIATFLFVCLVLAVHFRRFANYDNPPPASIPGYRASPEVDLLRVQNESLGFSKIFVVGLPERSDKRDALTLTAALTGFHVEWVDGVKGDTISDKALPFVIDPGALGANSLGSWRGHMNAVRKIVEENLDSALIMEDDMDWDVHLKMQLPEVAIGALVFQPSGTDVYRTPYGDDWDLLWLGHCGEVFPETLPEVESRPADEVRKISRKHTIVDDGTVPPPQFVSGFQDFAAHPHTRWVAITGAPICTFAYALSQRGARKVLYELAVDRLNGAYDNQLADLCRRSIPQTAGVEPPEGLSINCLTVTPPVFFHHKAKGRVGSHSDIQDIGEDWTLEKGTTENIMWSARNNIANMIAGLPPESQFEAEP